MSEVTLKINSKVFEFWTSFQMTMNIGSPDTFSYGAPFEPSNQSFRDAFRPLSFLPVEVEIDGALELTGTTLGVNPEDTPESNIVSVDGYSLSGVLNDCQISAADYPVEYSEQNLQQIAKIIGGPFGITVEFADQPGQPFEQVAAQVNQKAFAFLASLAQERGLLIGNNADGGMLFQKAAIDAAVSAVFRGGEPGVGTIILSTEAQKIFSSVTAHGATIVGLPPDSYTAINPRISANRPFVFKTDGSDSGDVKPDAEAKLGRMYGAALSVSVDVVGWQDPGGKLWRPNTIVNLTAPEAMIYNETRFLVKSVSLRQTAESETANLTLVLPESYSSKVPERLPWEE